MVAAFGFSRHPRACSLPLAARQSAIMAVGRGAWRVAERRILAVEQGSHDRDRFRASGVREQAQRRKETPPRSKRQRRLMRRGKFEWFCRSVFRRAGAWTMPGRCSNRSGLQPPGQCDTLVAVVVGLMPDPHWARCEPMASNSSKKCCCRAYARPSLGDEPCKDFNPEYILGCCRAYARPSLGASSASPKAGRPSPSLLSGLCPTLIGRRPRDE